MTEKRRKYGRQQADGKHTKTRRGRYERQRSRGGGRVIDTDKYRMVWTRQDKARQVKKTSQEDETRQDKKTKKMRQNKTRQDNNATQHKKLRQNKTRQDNNTTQKRRDRTAQHKTGKHNTRQTTHTVQGNFKRR